uniref:Envelope protein n=1 Tax=Chibugado virus TaxID=2689361 RepID=A0A6B9KN18_9VIRU|nr:envelope protein [Chibugado virus]
MFGQANSNQFTKLIEEKFNEIDSSLKNLSPMHRNKRWDTLGKVWKFIAGSPDAQDLKIINSSINSLVLNNNAQIRINREISLQMKEATFKAKEAIDLFNAKSSELYALNIFLNLDFLQRKLDLITETITLAKIGVLNEKILSSAEVELVLRDLAKENLSAWNAAEALTYLSTAIASNEREIVLLIKLPKLDPRQFQKALIVPILNNNRQIHLANRNYLIFENKPYIVSSLQPTIFPAESLVPDNSECLPNLLEGKSTSCDYISNPTEEVIEIDRTHIIVNKFGNTTLVTTCGVMNRSLPGPYLVSYDDCEVNIDNHTFRSTIKHISGNPIQLPLYGIPIKERNRVINLSLEHLHQLHLETREKMELLHLETNSLQWSTWTIFGGLTPMLIGIVFVLSFSCYRKMKISCQSSQPDVNPEPEVSHQPIASDAENDTPVEGVTVENTMGFRNPSLADIIRTEPHI